MKTFNPTNRQNQLMYRCLIIIKLLYIKITDRQNSIKKEEIINDPILNIYRQKCIKYHNLINTISQKSYYEIKFN